MGGIEDSRHIQTGETWRSEVRARLSLKWNSVYKKDHGVSFGLISAAIITQCHKLAGSFY